MNVKTRFRYVSIFILALVLLIGCGKDRSSESVVPTTTPTTTPIPTIAPTSLSQIKGHLTKTVGDRIDSYIEGTNYICADGSEGLTDATGTFECTHTPITFKVGGLTLGVLENFTADGNVYLQDLLALDRKTYANKRLTLLGKLLQSLDSQKTKDKITITQSVRNSFTKEQNFKDIKESDFDAYR